MPSRPRRDATFSAIKAQTSLTLHQKQETLEAAGGWGVGDVAGERPRKVPRRFDRFAGGRRAVCRHSDCGNHDARTDTVRAMSLQNVEMVRYVYESGLIDRDPEELLKLATPDVEYINPPYAVEPGVRRGLGPVAQAMRRFAEVWEESRHELRELYDCGDMVVAAVSWHIRSRGSERELVNQEAHTWTLHEGRIVRFEWGQDLGHALEAAGVAD
jgi:ketosteroid isomerase-like protein